MQVYFPPSMQKFVPGKMVFSTWVDHIPFAYDLVGAIRPKLLVELGTQNGMSFFTFCQAMKEYQVDGLCYAVDSWAGDEHTGAYNDSVFESVQGYCREEFRGFSYLMRMLFNEALQHFSDDSIDLLHIDGFHTHEAVSEDFRTWYPKVKPGGIILFHDIKARLKDFGAWRFWDEISTQYPSFTFNHGFGLGIIRKPGGVPAASQLTDILFTGSPQDHEQLRALYVIAGEYIQQKRQRLIRQQKQQGQDPSARQPAAGTDKQPGGK